MKHVSLSISSLAIFVVFVAFAMGCTDEPAEEPVSGAQQEDARACPSPAEPSATPELVEGTEATPHLQSPEEALAQDLALIADSRGWTFEEAEAHYLASEALDPITSALARERSEIFVGSVLSTDAGGPPARIYIKGPADDFVRDLVVAAGVEIEIVDNQPYSRDELHEREAQVASALLTTGFENFSASANVEEAGRIEVDVSRQDGLPDEPDEIIASMPEELRESVTVTVRDASQDCDE